jgi:hypothetical protein
MDISSNLRDQASSARGTTEQQQHLCIAALTEISSSRGDKASSTKGTTEQQQRCCMGALTDISVVPMEITYMDTEGKY